MKKSAGAPISRDRLEEWLEGYRRAWEGQDADAMVALFTEEARYDETPFARNMKGHGEIHEYSTQGPQYQKDVKFGYDILSVDPALVHWWAGYVRTADGQATKLDGIFWLEFDDDGRCTWLREWWHADPAPSF